MKWELVINVRLSTVNSLIVKIEKWKDLEISTACPILNKKKPLRYQLCLVTERRLSSSYPFCRYHHLLRLLFKVFIIKSQFFVDFLVTVHLKALGIALVNNKHEVWVPVSTHTSVVEPDLVLALSYHLQIKGNTHDQGKVNRGKQA